jgi:formamidase
VKSVEIDRSKRLKDQQTTGHNRFHPDVPPIVIMREGEDVALQTRDGVDGQLGPGTTAASMASMEAGAIHPLTGPVFVEGAEPGDVLEVEFLDIVAEPHAFTAIVPGLGFLRDVFTTPFLATGGSRTASRRPPRCQASASPGRRSWACRGLRPRRSR